jgi:hypothetical protein
MIILRYTAILSVLISIYCCSTSDPIIRRYKFEIGEFNYKLTDSSGKNLVSGVMKVSFLKENNMSGSYTVVKEPDVQFDGMETLKDNGGFTGQYNDSSAIVFFNMNPKIADANIFINAKDYTDSLKGTWNYSTFRGNKSGGFYSAKRIK